MARMGSFIYHLSYSVICWNLHHYPFMLQLVFSSLLFTRQNAWLFFNLVTVKYLFSATICISSNLLFINTFILHTHLLKVTNIASSISDLTWPSLNHCFLLRCVGGGGAGNTLLILLSVTVPRALPSALTSLFLAQVLTLKLKGINVGPD